MADEEIAAFAAAKAQGEADDRTWCQSRWYRPRHERST